MRLLLVGRNRIEFEPVLGTSVMKHSSVDQYEDY